MKEVFSYCRDSILKSCNSSVRTHSNVYCKLIIVMFDMWSFNFLNLRKTSKILKGTPWKVFFVVCFVSMLVCTVGQNKCMHCMYFYDLLFSHVRNFSPEVPTTRLPTTTTTTMKWIGWIVVWLEDALRACLGCGV